MKNITDKNGLVLVTVLWVAIILTVIVAAVAWSSRLDTKVCVAAVDSLELKWACRAGVETADAVLNDDLRQSDSLKDLWSENDIDFNDIELEGCTFDVRVFDEAAKLNVNTATREQLLALPEMTEEIADAIIDWRDRNDTASQAGEEGGYYKNLRYGYTIRNGRLRTIRELLLVKGVSENLFYGTGDVPAVKKDTAASINAVRYGMANMGWIEYLGCYSYDSDKDADGQARININDADENKLQNSLKIKKSHAKWIVENRSSKKYTSIADLINNNSPKAEDKNSNADSDAAKPLDIETFSAIADKITVNTRRRVSGRVNVNTASKVVLAALFGGGQDAEQIADDIIAYRQSSPDGMQSVGQLLQVSSVKVDSFKKVANYVTTRSDVYCIVSTGMSARAAMTPAILQSETVIDRSASPYNILYCYHGADN